MLMLMQNLRSAESASFRDPGLSAEPMLSLNDQISSCPPTWAYKILLFVSSTEKYQHEIPHSIRSGCICSRHIR